MRRLGIFLVLWGIFICGLLHADDLYGPQPPNLTYVFGTWTPTVTTSGTAGTPAYTTQVGSYEEIGRQITVRFTIVLSGWTGSPTGNIEIASLPFTSANVTNDNGDCVVTKYTVTGLASTNYGITGVISPNTAVVGALYSQGNTGTTQVTQAQAGSTATLIGFCKYHI